MSTILNSLKEKYNDIYNLLAKNQGENGLIFFVPNPLFYSSDSLNNKTFFYSHIFKKSIYDPNLYVNFLGKVLKSSDKKKFVAELGFKKKFELNVKNSYTTEDGILSFTTDGICVDGENDMAVIEDTGREKNTDFVFKRCSNSKEYLDYYSYEELKSDKYKKFAKGKSNLDKFIYAMKNNNILMKENEDAYGAVFFNSVSKLIAYFSSLFQNWSENATQNEKEQLKIAASEFVDSFVFNELYDDIMNKFKEFYKEEEIQIKKKLKENTNKFSVDDLKLPNTISNCRFAGVYKNLANLYKYKTCFEKKKFLIEINDQILKEANDTYKKATGKDLDIQADFMLSCWIYVLAHSGVDNLISEGLFFETLQVQIEKGQNEVIVSNFVLAVKYIKDELLKNEKDINVFMVKPFVVTTQE